MDEFDIDVAPLKHEAAGKGKGESESGSAPATARRPLAQRMGLWERVLRTGGILGTLLLAVALLVAVTPGARSAVAGVVLGPAPTPTPALADGNDRFAVMDQVPWGTFLVDGHPGPSLAPAYPPASGDLPYLTTFGLPRGRHQLEYRADPFPVLRCTLSVPAARSDTCPLAPGPIDYLVSDGPATRLLDLRGTVDRLPAAQANALADATQRALDTLASGARSVLAPGDHYLDADARVAVARERLTVEPTYTLSRSPQPGQDGHCATLCSDAAPWAQVSADEWWLYAFADVSWRYRADDGRVVLANGPPGPASARQAGMLQLSVRRVDGGWQVHAIQPNQAGPPVPTALLCSVGKHYLDVLRASPDQTTVGFSDVAYLWLAPIGTAEHGCLFAGGRKFDDQGNLTGAAALVLYRYGALLAVNDEAHSVFPHIPWANAHEQALALGVWPLQASASSASG